MRNEMMFLHAFWAASNSGHWLFREAPFILCPFLESGTLLPFVHWRRFLFPFLLFPPLPPPSPPEVLACVRLHFQNQPPSAQPPKRLQTSPLPLFSLEATQHHHQLSPLSPFSLLHLPQTACTIGIACSKRRFLDRRNANTL